MMKIIVPVSGGIDSMYLAATAYLDGHTVIPVTIDDGEPDHEEQVAARKICNILQLPEPVLLPIPRTQLLEMPNHRLSIEHDTPYIAGYKSLMYAVTLAFGMAQEADQIWFGVYAWNDHFLDETPPFAKRFEECWRGMYPDVDKVPTIEFPLMGLDKATVIHRSDLLHLPLDVSYSCFHSYKNSQGEVRHCGKCLACHDRQNSFKKAVVKDPTIYLTDEA